jgi:hypothetical protein
MRGYLVHRIAELLIHKPLHATVYLKGQSQFNEELAEFKGRTTSPGENMEHGVHGQGVNGCMGSGCVGDYSVKKSLPAMKTGTVAL